MHLSVREAVLTSLNIIIRDTVKTLSLGGFFPMWNRLPFIVIGHVTTIVLTSLDIMNAVEVSKLEQLWSLKS